MCMDDVKLFAKNEKKKLETLIHAVKINSPDRGIEFGIEKFAMLVMKSGKRHLTEGMELPNQDKIRTRRERETYKYLGIWEADIIKRVVMKEKIKKEYLRRKLLETKLCWKLIKGISIWAVPSLNIKARIDKTQQNSKRQRRNHQSHNKRIQQISTEGVWD